MLSRSRRKYSALGITCDRMVYMAKTPKVEATSFRFPPALLQRMRAYSAREGVSLVRIVIFGVTMWLDSRERRR